MREGTPSLFCIFHGKRGEKVQAVLALADGSIFRGTGFGSSGLAAGEICFNTAMTGYQEILTDPSYRGQIVTLTYPHIGNTGINSEDMEGAQIFCSALVLRNMPRTPSNWRSQQSLPDFLTEQGIPAIAGIDTRALTRRLRSGGAQNAALLVGAEVDEQEALSAARRFPGLLGRDLVQDVAAHQPSEWLLASGRPEQAYQAQPITQARHHVVVYDFGKKHNILRLLADRACRVTLVPPKTPAAEVIALHPDGVLFSNGPGDPDALDYAQEAMREIIAARIPTFGLCLGHQLLGLALGAKTTKMKFGHHGANHPVKDLRSGRVLITSQNHGFAVDAQTLPDVLRITHTSLFDGSLQGMAHQNLPVFSFQGHPEAGPGPHDASSIFDAFVTAMQQCGATHA
ncbi:MAG: glutamine-hydrolyzing carbamoyl-phosphate synthase small subunit [Acidithiobacillaceae bacterium]|nr:glutamine-hydrolyzing carbamoyl-phosphate synthase small subunit [Acidithiobacillus montserratensis]MBN2678600.1 glutamine-hydrolyzing carbamoyl-phosphate synthase small subunit [Acidithiobacillaceae bacterium]MBU2748806.1 glutamine-hydrolyzing carbamoyl-phosphate synthase small subunit [Acidithiobacillus montserratensis]